MCECGHGLDAYDMHRACCPFGGQQITTHDKIKDVIYVFAQESGHIVWIEQWYGLMSKTSI
jgi:hypothetical protein